MAAILARCTSGEQSLVAATAKTVLQLVAAANHRVKVLGLRVFFKGTAAGDTPVKIRVLRQTTAGTMSSGTVGTYISKNNDGDDETLQTTVQYNATAEPTAGDVLDTYEVHPQSGLAMFFPFSQEIIIKGGGRLGIECNAAQAQTVTVSADIEE